MAAPVPWACCAVLAAAAAVVYAQRHSPQGECQAGGGRGVLPADSLPELSRTLSGITARTHPRATYCRVLASSHMNMSHVTLIHGVTP